MTPAMAANVTDHLWTIEELSTQGPREATMDPWKGITWYEGIRIGWLLVWRGLLIGFLIGFVIGFLGGIFRIPQGIYFAASMVVGAAIVWPMVISTMLREKFRGFHIAIVRESDSSITPNPSS